MRQMITILTGAILTVIATASDDSSNFVSDPQVFDGNTVSNDPVSFLTGDLATAAPRKQCPPAAADGLGDKTSSPSRRAARRVRPRAEGPRCDVQDATPQPAPYTDIYNQNDMLNLLSPPVLPKPALPTISDPTKKQSDDISKLERLFQLPSYDPTANTNSDEEEDLCPRKLVGDSQIPVCFSEIGRDALRLPRQDFYTLYNVRLHAKIALCKRPERLWCCKRVMLARHPKYPPEAPKVLTGFVCLNPEMEAFYREFNVVDEWADDPSKDPGKPLGE